MSSGVEADIALDAAVIASLGLVRVLGGTTGLAAAGSNALAAFAEGRAEVRARQVEETRRLDAAVADVLDRNARIAALAESARRHDAAVDLPEPLDISGRPVDDLVDWAARTDRALAAVEESLAASLAQAAAGRVFGAASGSLRAGLREERAAPAPHPAERPAPDSDARAVSAPRPEEGTAPVPRPEERTPAPRPPDRDGLARMLARVLPDAAGADRQAVTDAVARIASAVTESEAEGWRTETRIRIQHANERARDRRDGRAAAARFLRELRDHPAADSVRRQLEDVAGGTRPFDTELRAAAGRLVDQVQKEAEQRYVAGALRAAFGDLGYEVDEGFETLTAQDGEAVLTRGDWPQHAVKVRIDDARQVRMALLRTEPAEGDEQRRLDVEREEQWCASFDAARERLAEAGIRADVRWRIEPGAQRLPLARPRSQSRQGREHHRERGR